MSDLQPGNDHELVTAIPTDFGELFTRASGHSPYDYQRALVQAGESVKVLEVPTGSGKTLAVLCEWLHRRLVRGLGPRRLVYALPMRSLVEQTFDVALAVRERLGLDDEELPIHVLMGGESSREWAERPESNQILIGTIDMLLSRAMNRGYAESRYAWPVSFGLLNADTRWVFDEVQLMGPARGTSAQLAGLREKLGTVKGCETLWVSATIDEASLRTVDHPELGSPLRLSATDRQAEALGSRLSAAKQLERIDLSGSTGTQAPKRIAAELADRHEPATRTLCVLNTVRDAQAVFRELHKRQRDQNGAPHLVLLHSRYRPPERRAHFEMAQLDPPSSGTIVVATQVVEAGVDMSSRLLATQTAPFSSIVQRLGRCNRAGEYPQATALWLDSGAFPTTGTGAKKAAPYRPEDLNATRDALRGLEGSSLSPAALEEFDAPDEHREEYAILRRRDLIDLFDTAPDLSGLDIDIGPFIRAGDEKSVSVFFREMDGDQLRRNRGDHPAEARRPDEVSAPRRDELVAVPVYDLKDREGWRFDPLEDEWVPIRGQHLHPGMTVMLAASQGGYDELGWNPGAKQPVEPIPPDDGALAPDALADDYGSQAAEWTQLLDHLVVAQQEARGLLEALELSDEADPSYAVVLAAAVHDVGKAHPVFQETLRRAATDEEKARLDGQLLAKSPHRGRHARRPFRHELASTLAVRDAQPGLLSDDERLDLVAYLVCAHHGKVRTAIRPSPTEVRPKDIAESEGPYALGILDGEHLPAVETPLGTLPATVLDLSCMAMGAPRSWSAAVVALRDDPAMGPFRLAFLEALVRVADWRASA
ncbi:MAG: type I-G CRISPR-associated helicase/endonuclease Cas3g [Solirubrobacterales bacterium]